MFAGSFEEPFYLDLPGSGWNMGSYRERRDETVPRARPWHHLSFWTLFRSLFRATAMSHGCEWDTHRLINGLFRQMLQVNHSRARNDVDLKRNVTWVGGVKNFLAYLSSSCPRFPVPFPTFWQTNRLFFDFLSSGRKKSSPNNLKAEKTSRNQRWAKVFFGLQSVFSPPLSPRDNLWRRNRETRHVPVFGLTLALQLRNYPETAGLFHLFRSSFSPHRFPLFTLS